MYIYYTSSVVNIYSEYILPGTQQQQEHNNISSSIVDCGEISDDLLLLLFLYSYSCLYIHMTYRYVMHPICSDSTTIIIGFLVQSSQNGILVRLGNFGKT